MAPEQLQGSCLCGAVKFSARGPFRDVVACHCGQCRKTSGHYLAATSVQPENFSLLEERGLKWFRASDIAKRGFCGECGCSLLWEPDDKSRICIFAGALDGKTGLKLASHIFTADKGDYYEIPDSPGAEATGAAAGADS